VGRFVEDPSPATHRTAAEAEAQSSPPTHIFNDVVRRRPDRRCTEHRLKPSPQAGDTGPVLILLADDGGSFTVSPNLELVLWTLFVVLLVVAVIYGIARLVAHNRRNG
jgi:hypothetical protein